MENPKFEIEIGDKSIELTPETASVITHKLGRLALEGMDLSTTAFDYLYFSDDEDKKYMMFREQFENFDEVRDYMAQSGYLSILNKFQVHGEVKAKYMGMFDSNIRNATKDLDEELLKLLGENDGEL